MFNLLPTDIFTLIIKQLPLYSLLNLAKCNHYCHIFVNNYLGNHIKTTDLLFIINHIYNDLSKKINRLENLSTRLVSLIEHQNNTIDNLHSSIRQPQSFPKPQPIIFPTSPDFGSPFALVQCSSCNSYGHNSNNCHSSKPLQCERCNSFNHITANCHRRGFF